jgi:hypothetical protein
LRRTFTHEAEGGNPAQRLQQQAALEATQEMSLR